MLPTPSWKAVIEVNNSDSLEQALERMTAAIRKQANANAAHSLAIEPSDDGPALLLPSRHGNEHRG